MKITFQSTKEQRYFEDFNTLKKDYGERMAKKIIERITRMKDAETAQQLPPSFRFHEHSGKRKGLYSVDLVHPFRLIVLPTCEYESYVQITSVQIYEIMDPH